MYYYYVSLLFIYVYISVNILLEVIFRFVFLSEYCNFCRDGNKLVDFFFGECFILILFFEI